jgi:NTE family protein
VCFRGCRRNFSDDKAMFPTARGRTLHGGVTGSFDAMRTKNVGLVLGGGGLTGLAYHAGALLALQHDRGWDPRTARYIVGTSAGALTAALLRRDVPADDMAAMTVGAEPRSTPARIRSAIEMRPPFPALRPRDFLHRPHLPNRHIVANWLRRPWRVELAATLASIVADGALDLAIESLGGIEAIGTAWPPDDLWICAVRQRDLRRVVFGRHATAPLDAAVIASCAVPGYVKPAVVDGVAYVDGGVHSPTNADVLRGAALDLDLVIVVSPMSGRNLPCVGLGPALRRSARRRVLAEVGRIEASGTPTLLIEPGRELAALLGTDFMDETNLRDIVSAAFFDTGALLHERAASVDAIDLRHSA